MQSNTTCSLVEQYLGYLVVIKGRSDNTVKEYRTDLLMFFNYIMNLRNITIINENFAQADLEFIKSITLHDMYSLSVVGKGNKERKIFLTPAAKKLLMTGYILEIQLMLIPTLYLYLEIITVSLQGLFKIL